METIFCLVGEGCEKYLGVKLMDCLVSFMWTFKIACQTFSKWLNH